MRNCRNNILFMNILIIFIFISLLITPNINLLNPNNILKQNKYKIIHNKSKGIWEQQGNVKIDLIENFSIGKKQTDTFMFAHLTHIVLDNKGNIYALDKGNLKIYKFDKVGNFLLAFGNEGNGPGEFISPKDMGITSSGTLCVVDNRRMRLIKYSSNGQFVDEFHTRKRRLNDLLCTSKNQIILCGPMNDKIFHLFELDGTFIKSIGEPIEYYSENRKYLKKISKQFHLLHRTPFTFYIDSNDHIIHDCKFANRMRIFNESFDIVKIIQRDDPDFTPAIWTNFGLKHTAGCSSILRMNDGKIIKFMRYLKDYEKADDDCRKMEIYDNQGNYLASFPIPFEGYGVAVDDSDNILFVINEEKSYIISYKLAINY